MQEAITNGASRTGEPGPGAWGAEASSLPWNGFGLLRLTDVRWYASFCAGLLFVSLGIVVAPLLPVAFPNTVLATVVATVAAAAGLSLLHLGLLRFFVLGHPLDVWVGLAFGVLALSNLVVRLLIPLAGLEAIEPDASLYAFLGLRAVTVGLLWRGLTAGDSILDRGRRRAFAVHSGRTVLVASAVGLAVLVQFAQALPSLLDPGVYDAVEAGLVIVDVLHGQTWGLVTVNVVLGAMLGYVGVGYLKLAHRHGDPHLGIVAVALTLLAFSQLHALLFPPVGVGYVSTADLFRLAAYLLLLSGLVVRIGDEFTERASREERLRLSRDLHDGLVQQLALLNMRLGRAAASDRPLDSRLADVEVARRVAESALLEARQALVVLRTGIVSWQSFKETLASAADNFSQNHEMDVSVQAGPGGPSMALALQIEVLRMVQEACSNALRHGQAAHVEVTVGHREDGLELLIRDDGRGFDPAATQDREGIGLLSMRERVARHGGLLSIDSAYGAGTEVRAWFPLRGKSAPVG